jgi:hypothetical protein
LVSQPKGIRQTEGVGNKVPSRISEPKREREREKQEEGENNEKLHNVRLSPSTIRPIR